MDEPVNKEQLIQNLNDGYTQKVIDRHTGLAREIVGYQVSPSGSIIFNIVRSLGGQPRLTPEIQLAYYRMPKINNGEGIRKSRKRRRGRRGRRRTRR